MAESVLFFASQSDARAVMPMLLRKPRFSLIWTGKGFRSRQQFRCATARFLRLYFARKVNVSPSCSVMLKDAPHREEVPAPTQERMG